jgi:hypothetical protein
MRKIEHMPITEIKYRVGRLIETGGHRLKSSPSEFPGKSLGWFVEEI